MSYRVLRDNHHHHTPATAGDRNPDGGDTNYSKSNISHSLVCLATDHPVFFQWSIDVFAMEPELFRPLSVTELATRHFKIRTEKKGRRTKNALDVLGKIIAAAATNDTVTTITTATTTATTSLD